MKPDNVLVVNTTLDKLFKNWFIFLKPVHNLTDRQIDIVANFVKQRYLLSKNINDDNLLDRVTMSEDTKRKVREECNVTLAHFQVIMSELRKNNIIVDGKISSQYIPRIKEDGKDLKFLIYFKINNEV